MGVFPPNESLFIVVHFETKSIICGTIYRPPKIDAPSVSKFFDDLKFVLSELKKSENKSYLMGDLNFNLLDSSDNSTEMLVDTMFDHHFYPLINKPTRITEKSYSAIDHIWTDIINTKINCNIVRGSVKK